VFLWFIAASVLAVQFVFQDPRFDYRLLIIGVLAPDVTMIMLATRNRRGVRKRVLPLAIGTFLHLIFDGAFANTNVFWWPFAGWSFGDAALPVADRGAVNLVLEVLGLAGVIFIVKRHGLADASKRREFLRTGVLQVPA